MSEPAPPSSDAPRSTGSTGPSRWLSRAAALADAVWAFPLALLAEIGLLARLLVDAVRWGVRPPYRGRVLVAAMDFLGVQSLFIVGLTGVFVGAVFSLQTIDGFRRLSAENQVGTIISLALARELAPVFSALMISSRAGSAIATELGSMRVSSQIDALTTMSVSPVQYLVSPRLLAAFLMGPVLALLFYLVGLVGAYLVATELYGLDGGIFLDRVRWYVDGIDLWQGTVKSAVFGVAVTLIACRQGFHASGGAAGVGLATNRAVVQSAVAILVLDYFVTTFFV